MPLRRGHVWGCWTSYDDGRLMRFCISGYCIMGQYRNGRTFVARPERRKKCR